MPPIDLHKGLNRTSCGIAVMQLRFLCSFPIASCTSCFLHRLCINTIFIDLLFNYVGLNFKPCDSSSHDMQLSACVRGTGPGIYDQPLLMWWTNINKSKVFIILIHPFDWTKLLSTPQHDSILLSQCPFGGRPKFSAQTIYKHILRMTEPCFVSLRSLSNSLDHFKLFRSLSALF